MNNWADQQANPLAVDLYGFRPNARRACLIDIRVRAGLAESLTAVLDALCANNIAPGRDDLIARIRAKPVTPGVFGLYTELVETVYADDLVRAMRLVDELRAACLVAADDLRVVTLSDSDLGQGQADRYRRLVDDDPDFAAALQPLAAADVRSSFARVIEGLKLLDAAEPELAGEIRALVREVVLVGASPEVDASFNGASCFHLWGALFLNASAHPTRVEMVEALAHESGHALLFGFSLGETLVRNDPAARFASPLRSDPRPMDGIVHATYVLGRMHYAMAQLVTSNLLTDEERRFAAAARARHARGYAEGLQVIDEHALWKPPGEAAIASVRSYMREAAQV